MEWKFRKEFQIMPGVKFSYGKTGIRTEITAPASVDEKNFELEKLKYQLTKPYNAGDEIKSVAINQLTSESLKELKSLLTVSYESFEQTRALLEIRETDHGIKSKRKTRLEKSFFKFFFKKKIIQLSKDINLIEQEISELKDQLSLSIINIEIDSDDVYQDLYSTIVKAFEFLQKSVKKWDFTSSKKNNMVSERTSAAHSVTRSDIEVSFKKLPIISSDISAMCFHNINGGDIYFYPGFIIVYESKEKFALLSYTDIQTIFNWQRFIEQEVVPSDAKVVDQTWLKVNKDGSRDKRFSGNYQIPIVEYGQLQLKSLSGLNELYCFSNAEYTMLFEKALSEYASSLRTADALLNEF